ncbi:FAD-binding domain-containing protein [Byssothecium circinans]|uniref:FAD-binding domain-containing protein n=1 Tax=Byssothecium circinans TaxID=147558 RepID=A0A6A5U1B9_9PLEO|nr:FAD-binding domain-containing protein [Byssothecium circinans]
MALKKILTETLPSKLLTPGNEEYDKSNNSYFTVFASSIKPSFIVQPTSVDEVSGLLRSLHPLLVNDEAKLAVKGTGHTPFAGSANIENGVTVDLQRLKGITLNEDKSAVTIRTGETWESVYAELEKYGVTAAGGRVGRVGVGGLVLGGGLSFFSTRHGFACDSVTDFEVVLASGEVVHANMQENPDLLVSLRGGLNNFGIVTSFTMKTLPSGNMWGGINYYMPGSFGALIEATVDFVQNEKDPDTHLMSSMGYGMGQQVVTCCMYHTKGVENPPSLQPFTSQSDQIKDYSSLRTATHIEFCNELSSFTKDGVRSFYATCTIRPDVGLMNNLHREFLNTLEELKSAEGLIFSLGFFPLTKSLLENSKAAGGNAKDIDPSDGPLFIILLNPTWDSPTDDVRVHQGVEDLLAKFKKVASERGLLHRYLFTNYTYQKDDALSGYGEESLERMRKVSEKFDPAGVFQKAVPGGFKINVAK